MKTVAKAMSLLLQFSASRPDWGLSEISRATGIDKVIAHRLLRTLAGFDMVAQDTSTRRYRLGPAVVELAGYQLAKLLPLEVGRPHLLALWEDTRETIHLVVPRRHEVAAMLVLESPQPMRVAANFGERAPAYCTPSGKTFLAFGTDELRNAVLAGPLIKHTPATIVSRTEIEKELAGIRKKGVAFDFEEATEHVRAVAAPVFGRDGKVEAAVALLGPAVRMPRRRMTQLARQVIATAGAISRELGYPTTS